MLDNEINFAAKLSRSFVRKEMHVRLQAMGARLCVGILLTSVGFNVPTALGSPNGENLFFGWLVVDVSPEENAIAGPKSGIRVEKIFPDSPAARAGLRKNDVVSFLGGKRIPNLKEYSEWRKGIPAKKPFAIVFERKQEYAPWRTERSKGELIPLSEYAFKSSAEGFRGCPWGSSRDSVAQIELSPIRNAGADVLQFETELGKQPAEGFFFFSSDKLCRGKYVLDAPDDLLQAWLLKSLLERIIAEKYGAADRSDDITGSRTLDDLEFNILSGKTVMSAEWLLLDCSITIVLRGELGNLAISIEYVSHEFGPGELRSRFPAPSDF